MSEKKNIKRNATRKSAAMRPFIGSLQKNYGKKSKKRQVEDATTPLFKGL